MIAEQSTRKFAAGFFALVALGAAVLLQPLLWLDTFRLKLVLPLLAAACAYGWAWVLHPCDEAKIYGPARGVVVALLAYLSFVTVLAVCGFREAGLLIVGLLLTPFPAFALAAGAVAGAVDLRHTRSSFVLLSVAGSRMWATWIASCRAMYARVDAKAADPSNRTTVTTIVSSCLFLAGATCGFAWIRPEHASADAGAPALLRLLPVMVALILALTGWLCGRVVLTILTASQRLRISLTSTVLASAAVAWFAITIQARLA